MKLIRKLQILWCVVSLFILYLALADIYYYTPKHDDEFQPYIDALLLISNVPFSILGKMAEMYLFNILEFIFKIDLHNKGYNLGYFFTFIDWLIVTLSGACQWFIFIPYIFKKIAAKFSKQ